MLNQRILAFTCQANGRANVLQSSVSVSAHKRLFPEAQIKEFRAIWDTGATNTAITKKVADQCNLIPTGKVQSNTASGKVVVNTYLIDLHLPNSVTVGKVVATECGDIGGADVLVGMDVIGLGDLAISNFNNQTAFSFRFPSVAKTDYVEQLKLQENLKNNTIKSVPRIGRNDICQCRKWEKI